MKIWRLPRSGERVERSRFLGAVALQPDQRGKDSSMKIIVKLHGVLRIDRFRETELSVPDGSRVDAVLERLQLPDELLDIILVNGRHADRSRLLEEGDILSLLPMLEGG